MSELIRTVQWNIGGGKVRNLESHLVDEPEHDIDGLDTIISTLEGIHPDIITLQETHSAEDYSQARFISEALDLPYWVNDTYAESHIDPEYRLGQAIISRHPLTDHDFRLFINPGYKSDWASTTHDKGVTSVLAHIGTKAALLLQTVHAVPFSSFGVDQESDLAKPVIVDMQSKILGTNHNPRLLQGDFNLHGISLKGILPTIFRAGFDEVIISEATTPKGRIYDHVLFSGLIELDSCVDKNVLTDHYPVVTTLQV